MSIASLSRRWTAAAGLWFGIAAAAPAQPLDLPELNVPVVNGPVYASARLGTLLYLGGAFDHAAPYTGHGVVLSASSGLRDAAWPAINGTVYAAIPDGVGGWYAGGEFSRAGSAFRSGLVHLLPDKTVDPAWDPNVNGPVYALALSGTTVYAGGDFTAAGPGFATPRSRLAAFDAATGAVTAWTPEPDGTVRAIAVAGSIVYAGGDFTSAGTGPAIPRSRLAAFAASTGAATSWDPNPNGTVRALAISGTTLYAGGDFTSAGASAQTRNRLAAFDTTSAAVLSWNPNVNGRVNTLVLSGTTAYAGGLFTQAGPSFANARRNAAAFNASGAITSWNPSPDAEVFALAVNGTTIHAAGAFGRVNAAGTIRRNLAAFNNSDGAVAAWDPSAGSVGRALSVFGTSIFAGGNFAGINGATRNRLAAFNLLSGQVTAWDPNVNNDVYALRADLSGVFAGGAFTGAGTNFLTVRNRLAVFDFQSGAVLPVDYGVDGDVLALEYAGGVLYAGGEFTRAGSAFLERRNRLAAFDGPTGALSDWDPNVNGQVRALKEVNGQILAGGYFTRCGPGFGIVRNALASFDDASTTGTPDAWDPNVEGGVHAIEADASAIFAGGFISAAGPGFAAARSNLAAFDPASGALLPWDPMADAPVHGLRLIQGELLAGGDFTGTGPGFATPRGFAASFDPAAGTVNPWNPNFTYPVRTIGSLGLQIHAGGEFIGVGIEERPYAAVFDFFVNSASPRWADYE